MRDRLSRPARIAAGVAALPFAVALVRTGLAQGQDFSVLRLAAGYVLGGTPAYDIVRDGAMCFKYPPWVLPLFFPFAWLPLEAAKLVWALLELGSLAVVVRWLIRRGVAEGVALAAAAGFWGIWAVHLMDGQVMLPILAAVLTLSGAARGGAWAGALANLALSSKLFTWLALPGIRRAWSPRALLLALALGVGLSVPAISVQPLKPGDSNRVAALVRAWQETARSGGSAFDGEKTRGRDNQGLPALFLRKAGISAAETEADLWAFVWCASVLGGLWLWIGRRQGALVELCGWLAITAVSHPLAWFHQFTLAFPLATVSIDRALRSRSRLRTGLSLAGFAALALVTRKTLGPLGEALELGSIKSWGALLCLASVCVGPRKERSLEAAAR